MVHIFFISSSLQHQPVILSLGTQACRHRLLKGCSYLNIIKFLPCRAASPFRPGLVGYGSSAHTNSHMCHLLCVPGSPTAFEQCMLFFVSAIFQPLLINLNIQWLQKTISRANKNYVPWLFYQWASVQLRKLVFWYDSGSLSSSENSSSRWA